MTKLRSTILFVTLSLFLLNPSAHAAVGDEISEAEKILFMTDHLKNVSGPAVIQYNFKHDGQLEAGFEDQVKVELKKTGGAKTAVVHFLTGERKATNLLPVNDVSGNPVLLGFLERDISEMKRLTGGATAYFRKRIRLALVDKAEIKPATFTYEGKEIKGHEITIRPFVDDPNKLRMVQYINKNYQFVLSEQVLGGVFQIRTSVPAAEKIEGGKGNPSSLSIIEETLTLDKQTKGADKT
ncbi:MAG: hypothetical protein WCD07_01990 [Burkholderiales bacterium]